MFNHNRCPHSAAPERRIGREKARLENVIKWRDDDSDFDGQTRDVFEKTEEEEAFVRKRKRNDSCPHFVGVGSKKPVRPDLFLLRRQRPPQD